MSSRYISLDHEVPENKFHITDHVELQRRETPLALRRLLELQQAPVTGNFETAHLCAIHRYLFQDVYEWAGEIRSVNISKPGAFFPPPEYIVVNLDRLFIQLAEEQLLRRLDQSLWVKQAAYYLGEINAIHPFREGNGRTQREFVRQLASAGGHLLTWKRTTPEAMIEASQRSFLGKDYRGLETILQTALDR